MKANWKVSLCIFVFFVATTVAVSNAQRKEPAPKQLQEVGVTERLEEQLPLDLTFQDERGRGVRLGDFFTDRPVILTLTYSDCPMLC